jgi:hypothetical protein
MYYDTILRIAKCAYENAGSHLQDLMVQRLRAVNELRAANWFQDYWTGSKGRWLFGNGGIGCIGNNQGIKSTWRWDRMAVSGGRQVRV